MSKQPASQQPEWQTMTELAPRNQVVRIGTGRDATDVAFATIFGTAQMTQMSPNVKVLEERVEDVAVAIATS